MGKYIKMKKIITIFLSVTLFGGILFTQEKGGLFGRKSKDETAKKDIILIKDPYTIDDLNKIESDFNSGKSLTES